ncbi:hypothetical protein SUGI_0123740 [Cryptomeria japonica]|nr:hypothetical protein SUGI_0123740 [Cryptomeria japonica]
MVVEGTTTNLGGYIHVSTDEVNGETEKDDVVGDHEASQLLPTNPYSATTGDGSNVRSYLYCEDVSEAIEVVLHRGDEFPTSHISDQEDLESIQCIQKKKILGRVSERNSLREQASGLDLNHWPLVNNLNLAAKHQKCHPTNLDDL